MPAGTIKPITRGVDAVGRPLKASLYAGSRWMNLPDVALAALLEDDPAGFVRLFDHTAPLPEHLNERADLLLEHAGPDFRVALRKRRSLALIGRLRPSVKSDPSWPLDDRVPDPAVLRRLLTTEAQWGAALQLPFEGMQAFTQLLDALDLAD